ncbi:hypothetical protein OXYTRIMIC_501 [Oxytricha trifallax]|uniref:Uncharacterized protein n=1 Tax=Oxytricha trifallax TaxID=1172189 RepID=A0A073IBD0_9SPIT|nr:hypothetical protein OXYTRIMIC_501 [Oxytricha trifallax]
MNNNNGSSIISMKSEYQIPPQNAFSYTNQQPQLRSNGGIFGQLANHPDVNSKFQLVQDGIQRIKSIRVNLNTLRDFEHQICNKIETFIKDSEQATTTILQCIQDKYESSFKLNQNNNSSADQELLQKQQKAYLDSEVSQYLQDQYPTIQYMEEMENALMQTLDRIVKVKIKEFIVETEVKMKAMKQMVNIDADIMLFQKEHGNTKFDTLIDSSCKYVSFISDDHTQVMEIIESSDSSVEMKQFNLNSVKEFNHKVKYVIFDSNRIIIDDVVYQEGIEQNISKIPVEDYLREQHSISGIALPSNSIMLGIDNGLKMIQFRWNDISNQYDFVEKQGFRPGKQEAAAYQIKLNKFRASSILVRVSKKGVAQIDLKKWNLTKNSHMESVVKYVPMNNFEQVSVDRIICIATNLVTIVNTISNEKLGQIKLNNIECNQVIVPNFFNVKDMGAVIVQHEGQFKISDFFGTGIQGQVEELQGCQLIMQISKDENGSLVLCKDIRGQFCIYNIKKRT